jgi:hypothetical protein
MLSKFIVCRERFRLLVVEGLKPVDAFNHRIEYGQLWHTCEEALAAWEGDEWKPDLLAYCKELCKRYPLQQEQIEHWYNICKIQFSVYVDYWAKHKDVKDRTPLLQEEVFCVPYTLPSGRVVKLRGKFDSVDLIGKGKNAGIYLQENKTKGEINVQQLQRQLTFDLQTMFYLIALQEYGDWGEPIKGVRYNVIRRPLSGGKGSIRQKKNQSLEEYYAELGELIATADNEEWDCKPGEHYFFMRWMVDITPGDYQRFKDTFLDPFLEELCWWWDCQTGNENDYPPPCCHWRTPYGVYSPLLDGGTTELDEYLNTGSDLGLSRVDNLFPEL